MFNNNIFRKEMKFYRVSFIGWSASICALILLGMAFFPVLNEGDTLRQLTVFFETPFMKNILSVFGLNIGVLTNVLGFYCTRNAIFIMLLGSFFSIILASRILSLEEREKTAEFLLAKPVTRNEIVGSKLAAFLTLLTALNVIITAVGFASIEIFGGKSDYRISSFLTHSFYSFLLMLTFGAIGLFLSLLIKRGRSSTGLSIGIIAGSYFLDMISNVSHSADKIGYLSPFKFVDSSVLSPGYGLSWWRVLYFVGVSLVLFALTFSLYRKKDILV